MGLNSAEEATSHVTKKQRFLMSQDVIVSLDDYLLSVPGEDVSVPLCETSILNAEQIYFFHSWELIGRLTPGPPCDWTASLEMTEESQPSKRTAVETSENQFLGGTVPRVWLGDGLWC